MNNFHRNRTNRTVVMLVVILAASFALTRFWFNRPDLFPAFPGNVAMKLMGWYGAHEPQQVADLQIMVGLFTSVCLFGLLVLLANAAFCCVCAPKTPKKIH